MFTICTFGLWTSRESLRVRTLCAPNFQPSREFREKFERFVCKKKKKKKKKKKQKKPGLEHFLTRVSLQVLHSNGVHASSVQPEFTSPESERKPLLSDCRAACVSEDCLELHCCSSDLKKRQPNVDSHAEV